MRKTYRETISSHEFPVGLEDVRLELHASFQALEDEARARYDAEGLALPDRAESGLAVLKTREELLDSGLRESRNGSHLELFLDDLKTKTQAAVKFIRSASNIDSWENEPLIGNLLHRYGEGVQGSMILYGMLTPEAVRALNQIKDPDSER